LTATSPGVMRDLLMCYASSCLKETNQHHHTARAYLLLVIVTIILY